MADFDPNEYLKEPAHTDDSMDALLRRVDSKAPEKLAKNSKDALNAVASSYMPEGTANPVGKALSYVAEKTGLAQIPDRLIQSAVGMKKYIPGVGDELINQGIKGTKGGMQGQVAKGLSSQGNRLQSAVESIPGTVDSAPVAQRIQDMAKQYTTSAGTVPGSVSREAGLIGDTATEVAGRGQISPQEALELKRIAGRVGYKSGEPMSKMASQIAQQEGAGYGKALEGAYAQANPGTTNQVAESNKALSSLLKANKSLNMPKAPVSGGPSLADLGIGAAGSVMGGPGAGIGAVLAKKAASTPLVKSYGAHALSGVGQAAKQAPNRAISVEALENQQSAQPEPDNTFDPNVYLGSR